jgi:hypothetical protein
MRAGELLGLGSQTKGDMLRRREEAATQDLSAKSR